MIEDLCNGSTPDSDSVCGGSNPSSSAKTKSSSIRTGFLFCLRREVLPPPSGRTPAGCEREGKVVAVVLRGWPDHIPKVQRKMIEKKFVGYYNSGKKGRREVYDLYIE